MDYVLSFDANSDLISNGVLFINTTQFIILLKWSTYQFWLNKNQQLSM